MNFFLVLLDEIWLTILNEWVDRGISLCALDAALCNKCLRNSYLQWLRLAPSTFMLRNMKFELMRSAKKMPVADSFLYWCKKRNVYPKLLSMYFNYFTDDSRTVKQSKNENLPVLSDSLDVMDVVKHLEILENYCCHFESDKRFSL